MKRRHFLETAGALSLTAAAGCLDSSSSESTSTPHTGTPLKNNDTPGEMEATDSSPPQETEGSDAKASALGFTESTSFYPSPQSLKGRNQSDGWTRKWQLNYAGPDWVKKSPAYKEGDSVSSERPVPESSPISDSLFTKAGRGNVHFKTQSFSEPLDINNLAVGDFKIGGKRDGFTLFVPKNKEEIRVPEYAAVKDNFLATVVGQKAVRDDLDRIIDEHLDDTSFTDYFQPEMQRLAQEVLSRDAGFYRIGYESPDTLNIEREQDMIPYGEVRDIDGDIVRRTAMVYGPNDELVEATEETPFDEYF